MKWNHVLIEGYCARLWEYRSKHSKYCYVWDSEKDGGSICKNSRKVRNDQYDPKIKKPKRPKYCKKNIGIECIKCKHFAYAMVEPELWARFKKMVHEYFEEEK